MMSMIAAIAELFLFFDFNFCFCFSFFYLSDRSDHMETRLDLLPVHENKQTRQKKKKKTLSHSKLYFFFLNYLILPPLIALNQIVFFFSIVHWTVAWIKLSPWTELLDFSFSLFMFCFVLFVVAVVPSFLQSYDMLSEKRKGIGKETSNGF